MSGLTTTGATVIRDLDSTSNQFYLESYVAMAWGHRDNCNSNSNFSNFKNWRNATFSN